jgi:hypothetical protein
MLFEPAGLCGLRLCLNAIGPVVERGCVGAFSEQLSSKSAPVRAVMDDAFEIARYAIQTLRLRRMSPHVLHGRESQPVRALVSVG